MTISNFSPREAPVPEGKPGSDRRANVQEATTDPHYDASANPVPSEIISAAGLGWSLFPVKRADKRPLIRKWLTQATSDLRQIRNWANENPGCNWGVVTGRPSGLLVVDVDGVTGKESVSRLAEQGLILPTTVAVSTGREDGGTHYYYRMPDGLRVGNDQAGKISPKIDVRGDGGFVVCPPSIHASGKRYAYINANTLIADAPEWILDRLTRRSSPSTPPRPSHNTVIIGDRTNYLLSLAGTMNRKGIGPEAIYEALRIENKTKCKPPHDDAKVRALAWGIPLRYPSAMDGYQDKTLKGPPPEFSDDAIAAAFTNEFGDDFRFTASWGRWSVWDGKNWKQDSTSLVFDTIRFVCRNAGSRGGDSMARRIASAGTVRSVEYLARADRQHATEPDDWDRDPYLLNTPGGVVDLRSGELRPARREDMITKTTAVAPGGTCPMFLDFLGQITGGDVGMQRYLQKLFGHCLTGDTSEHSAFFLHGRGANGKSVLVTTIQGVLSGYATTAPIETFMASTNERHPTELAGLQGSRLLIANETEVGRRFAESKIKMLTGGDVICARFMRKDFFTFKPQFKPVFVGNHKPGLSNVDEAMRRRLKMIPFTHTIPSSKRDPKLAEKLRNEWPGILQWMIDGCRAWQAEGLTPPKVVVDATASYFAAEDILGRWLDECCEIGAAFRSAKGMLYKSFTDWCARNQESPISMKRFVEELEHRDFKSHRKRNERASLGLRLVRV